MHNSVTNCSIAIKHIQAQKDKGLGWLAETHANLYFMTKI